MGLEAIEVVTAVDFIKYLRTIAGLRHTSSPDYKEQQALAPLYSDAGIVSFDGVKYKNQLHIFPRVATAF